MNYGPSICLCCSAQVPKKFVLCRNCMQSVYSARNKSTVKTNDRLTVVSFYTYQGAVQSLIRNAKSKSNWRAAALLSRLFSTSFLNVSEKCDSAVLMPGPSSFWSRLRGKIDLPDLFCHGLHLSRDIPIAAPPFQLGWHTSKKAFREFEDRDQTSNSRFDSTLAKLGRSIHQRFNSKSQKGWDTARQVYLVDDVFTTGSTLHSVLEYIPQDIKVSAYCLAQTASEEIFFDTNDAAVLRSQS